MYVQPVDLGDEIRKGFEALLALAPVVVSCPVFRELLHCRELGPLRSIIDRLFFGKTRRHDPAAKVSESLFGNIDVEWTYRCIVGRPLCLFYLCHFLVSFFGWREDLRKIALVDTKVTRKGVIG
jgi:hypothetical protein